MKRKLIVFMFVFMFMIAGLLNAGLMELYKKGTIQLKAAPDFGKETEWDSLLYKESNARGIAIASDGTIFVANRSGHCVFMFSKEGKFIGKFGQRGEGPGDLNEPSELSILDNKYLVVSESSSKMRISLFDLKGKYYKVLRTKHSPSHPVALKNGKVAYMTSASFDYLKSSAYKQTRVFIKDVKTGAEKQITSFRIPDRIYFKFSVGKAVMMMKNNIGNVILSRTAEGNLLVGASNSPEINIYTADGTLHKTFQLQMRRTPVTSEFIAEFKRETVGSVEAEGKKDKDSLFIVKELKALPYKTMFAEYLPYYRNILVDSEGNILVFKWRKCINACETSFRVYSPLGKYLCETKLDNGPFDFKITTYDKKIAFTAEGIFGLFQVKDSEDTLIQVVKVPVD